MQKKSFIRAVCFLRFCASGLTATLVLNLLFSFYYRLPLHSDNPLHMTDYVWEKNAPWVKLTEGISWGRMDANGFNNRAAVENPDVIILGSSHMEAMNVFQAENTASLLQDALLESGSGFSVYNRGISGHHFLKCVKYLGENTRAASVKYAVIETSKIDFTAQEIENLLSDTIDFTPSYSTGILFYLQKLPLFRLFYTQVHDGLLKLFLPRKSSAIETGTKSENEKKGSTDSIHSNYEKLFSYIKENSNGKKIIIFYHPTGTPEKSGNLAFSTSADYFLAFSEAAKKHGISFIDLTDATEDLWQTQHKTTHGFCTGTAFSGHLNKNGHAIAAKALADVILRVEENGVAF